MKRCITFTILLLLMVSMIFSFASCAKVEVADGEIVAIFRHGDVDITQAMTHEDSETVRKMFNKKNLYSDSLSCGFSENVALIAGGDTYCIACDDCGIIYSVNEDKYFNLSDKENETLRKLLGEYGFTFPCV